MAYEKPITIKEAIDKIADDDYVLPAIQREFEWSTEQIETLFDSLMRDYPISTFLFWEVKAENIKRFTFYRFLKEYHGRDSRHNPKASLSGRQGAIAILDGQQRLTSIYIGLRGSHATRKRYQRVNNDAAYPKKRLYLNLLAPSEDITREYDFQFLMDEESEVNDGQYFWVPASKVLEFSEYEEASDWVNDTLMDYSENLEVPVDRETLKAGRRRLCTLYRAVCELETLNFYLEKGEELDKVLQIFIRINQGGTPLSYSDLLLSIATAQWKDLDAREVIHEFVDNLNDQGAGFNFNKDFVLKSCLVLADLRDVAFKVDNFSSENMRIIEEQWEEISTAVELAVKLAAHFGFHEKTLTSTNALIPVAYFIKKRGLGDGLIHAHEHADNRSRIKQWLIRVLLKRQYSGTPDNLYPQYRKIIQESEGVFPLPGILERFSGTNKSLDFYSEDIENLLVVEYGSAQAYMLLSLLYPIQHDYEFHQDHIHPKYFFASHRRLESTGISNPATRDSYLERYNQLPNLQLLQATPNMEKGKRMFEEWLHDTCPDPAQLHQYKDVHMIPSSASLAFDDFLAFYKMREEIIRCRLREILGVRGTGDPSSGVREEQENA